MYIYNDTSNNVFRLLLATSGTYKLCHLVQTAVKEQFVDVHVIDQNYTHARCMFKDHGKPVWKLMHLHVQLWNGEK